MMKDQLIALGLTALRPHGASSAHPDVGTTAHAAPTPLHTLLTLLRDTVAAAGLRDANRVLHAIAACQEAIAAEAGPGVIGRLIDDCDAAFRLALTDLQRLRSDQKEEIGQLVRMVREALAIVAGDGQQFGRHLDGSMQRFEAIAKLDDVKQLKARLATEIQALRQIAEDRRREWEATAKQFERKVDILERQLTVTRLEASLDPLTHVANRGAFDHTLETWIAQGKSSFVLGMIDIDNFKTINDSHGHSVGDHALVTVAENLRRCLRAETDVVGRVGGDEFAALIAGIPLRQAESRLRLVGSSLAAVPTLALGKTLRITLSIGVAEFSAGDTVESLKERADSALYEAKHLGRNRVVGKEKPTMRELLGR